MCVLATTGAQAGACDVAACAGMELAGGASPKVDSRDRKSETPAAGGQREHEPRARRDGDKDGSGNGSNAKAPPDFVQPPGCIFRDTPLELIV